MRFKLKAARQIAELTQVEAAESLGISRSTIQNWEAYRTSPRAEQAQKLSELYGIPYNQIYFCSKS